MAKQATGRRHMVWLPVLGLVVVGVAAGLILLHHKPATKQTATTKNNINYGPPTQDEQQSGNDQKQVIEQQQAAKPATTATVVISNLSQAGDTIRVRAFVSNVVESGGTCTTTLTNGSYSVSQQTEGSPDASTTQCGVINFTRDQFAVAGAWQVTVSYSSAAVSGSATDTLDIQ